MNEEVKKKLLPRKWDMWFLYECVHYKIKEHISETWADILFSLTITKKRPRWVERKDSDEKFHCSMILKQHSIK